MRISERGTRLARRDDREYREYLREAQRSQPGCPCTIDRLLREKTRVMKGCGSVWKPFCGFRGAVGAFRASTAPAASTVTVRLPRRECLDAPAPERRGRICAPARLFVRSLQWGVAPSSASTGVMESHDTSIRERRGQSVDSFVVRGN